MTQASADGKPGGNGMGLSTLTAYLDNRPWLRTLALAGVIVATVTLLWRSDDPALVSEDAAELRGAAEPDGFVVNGRYTTYDEAGRLKAQLTSPRIEQFEQENLAIMASPSAQLYGDPGTAPWLVEANRGRLLPDENLLQLTDKVRVIRRTGEQDSTLRTSRLTLDNNAGTVYTEAPVEITDRFGVTRATGMKAWINERILELNSQVEGRYETGK